MMNLTIVTNLRIRNFRQSNIQEILEIPPPKWLQHVISKCKVCSYLEIKTNHNLMFNSQLLLCSCPSRNHLYVAVVRMTNHDDIVLGVDGHKVQTSGHLSRGKVPSRVERKTKLPVGYQQRSCALITLDVRVEIQRHSNVPPQQRRLDGHVSVQPNFPETLHVQLDGPDPGNEGRMKGNISIQPDSLRRNADEFWVQKSLNLYFKIDLT